MTLKRVLVFVLLLSLVPFLGFSATASKAKVVVKKGAESVSIMGWSRNWKDVPKISAEQLMANRKMKPIMNFENPKRIVKQSLAIDPVVQTPLLTRNALAMNTPLITFPGMTLTANGAGWPPDTNGDVGGNYYIQTVNTSIGIYNKTTGALVSATTFDNFFGGTGITGTPCDADNNGDPIVLFDQFEQRWFILDFAWTGTSSGSSYAIAVSKTSDPTGAWWLYCLQADTSLMNDYPKCGIWGDGIYITANMFNFSTSAFQYAKVWALKKPDIYTGTLTVQSVTDSGAQAWSLLPSNARGTTAPPTGAPNYMYSIDADEFGGGATDSLYVWKYAVNWTTPASTTWTGPAAMPVAAYSIVSTGVPQQGTTIKLDSLYGRLMYPANYRKFATHEAVYLCHAAEANSTRQIRWYEIRIANGTSSIFQQGTYAPDTNHRWMGSICADKNGNIAMGYSVSSSTMYPAIRYAGRLATDTLGQMSQGEATLYAGTGYQSSYTRWGDYSSLTVDPADDETFWYTTEHYATSGTNWQTRIGSFKMTSTPDTTPPVISAVAAGSISDTTATITWTTNETATSVVNYGLTTAYGSTASIAGYTTAHSVALTGLTPQTTYHYKVTSVDASNNSAQSADYTFTTAATPTTPQMYVYNITMTKKSNKATAIVTIKDTNGANVSGALVYVTWSGAYSANKTGTTGTAGTVTFTSNRGTGTFTITVTNVTKTGYTYNSALNIKTSASI